MRLVAFAGVLSTAVPLPRNLRSSMTLLHRDLGAYTWASTLGRLHLGVYTWASTLGRGADPSNAYEHCLQNLTCISLPNIRLDILVRIYAVVSKSTPIRSPHGPYV